MRVDGHAKTVAKEAQDVEPACRGAKRGIFILQCREQKFPIGLHRPSRVVPPRELRHFEQPRAQVGVLESRGGVRQHAGRRVVFDVREHDHMHGWHGSRRRDRCCGCRRRRCGRRRRVERAAADRRDCERHRHGASDPHSHETEEYAPRSRRPAAQGRSARGTALPARGAGSAGVRHRSIGRRRWQLE